MIREESNYKVVSEVILTSMVQHLILEIFFPQILATNMLDQSGCWGSSVCTEFCLEIRNICLCILKIDKTLI